MWLRTRIHSYAHNKCIYINVYLRQKYHKTELTLTVWNVFNFLCSLISCKKNADWDQLSWFHEYKAGINSEIWGKQVWKSSYQPERKPITKRNLTWILWGPSHGVSTTINTNTCVCPFHAFDSSCLHLLKTFWTF